MHFIDEASFRAEAGHGGSGCVAFRREKFVPKGGPAGGDGGEGGSVLVVGDGGLNTLYHLRHNRLYKAERGRHGEGSRKSGRGGEDLSLRVPLGTIIEDTETGEILGEVLEHGEEIFVARGGRGGKGNAHFATPTRQAPRYAQPGEPGEERSIRLQLKLLADVGLVGLPNAGKSTLISVLSAARPKIADYPFTTLVPQLGVVAREPGETPFVIADLPGLIAGAAQGAGLGIRFLKHVDRCRVLVHLVDVAQGEMDAEHELAVIEGELEAFDSTLLDRPRLLLASKIDAADSERLEQLRAAATARDLELLEISSVTRDGLSRLVRAIVVRLWPEELE
ncbi:MAG: GTPase ObgE [Acidobacteriota bacterium]